MHNGCVRNNLQLMVGLGYFNLPGDFQENIHICQGKFGNTLIKSETKIKDTTVHERGCTEKKVQK